MSGLKRLSNVMPFRSIGWIPIGKGSQPNENVIEKESYSLDEICGSPAGIGEDKYCASSLESMKDFAISKLGTNIKKISGSFAQNQDQYVVEGVTKVADKGVMCHRLNFEKVVFYCHQVNATASYMVPLVAADGTEVTALAACHHDTRGMNPNLLYEVLKVRLGTVPVCHFVGNKAIAWIPNRIVGDHLSVLVPTRCYLVIYTHYFLSILIIHVKTKHNTVEHLNLHRVLLFKLDLF